ncbi:MAG: MBL fold metallo-hydrolase [Hyphomicrobiales bacterium]|nr:MBL fold metallo-hydrolase [Hyphomicrobiales bacterium]
MSKNPYYSGPVSDHFDGTRFFISGHTNDKSRADLLKWRMETRERAIWPKSWPSPFSDAPPQRVEGAQLRVSYIGHASFLIQTQGLNFLIDPVWSERASPLSFVGPRRVNAPGVAFDKLPPIDAVLVTHNHYDHLDMATLRRLVARNAPIVTPLGNDTIIRRAIPQARVHAYDWMQHHDFGGGVRAHLVPSYHWSARGLFDRRMALWASFVIETPGGRIYCIGDTGYRDGAIFRDVKMRFGAPRLALVPIGAYAPRWFMRDQHADPEEAVKILRDCAAQTAVAFHWGTFQLTDEPIDEPPRLLAEALAREGVAPQRFLVKRPGEFAWID